MRYLLMIALLAMPFVPIGCSGHSSSAGLDKPLSPDKPPALVKPELFPAQYQDAVRDVAASLTKDGKNPAEFYATIEEKDGLLVFSLWHETAFLPENAGVPGNPGGKCLLAHFDPNKRATVGFFAWQ